MEPYTVDNPDGDPPVKGSRRLFRRASVSLITDAKVGPGQDRHHREVVYAILQFIRIPALFVSIYLVYAHQAWLAAGIVSGLTLPLPWAAVVIANGRGQPKDKRERNVYKPALARQMAAQQREQVTGPQRRQLDQPETIDHDEPKNP
ncbi:DUF3099 domain-containing protein [Corynebacterium confusum]|uniref:DUF3099 domain-containing protein n=1 Tax=Corynebacterium confusum TaxID=71254 RepID=UPI0025B37A90|nr:DUF3099 domain-containing protein [Corynebacterium confusum]WJY89896.1 hypothetical protein CCONF_06870 [Corynebacterium confusum]